MLFVFIRFVFILVFLLKFMLISTGKIMYTVLKIRLQEVSKIKKLIIGALFFLILNLIFLLSG